MLNSRNNAFYGIFMPLHHSLGFSSMILEGGSFDPHDPPLDPLLNMTIIKYKLAISLSLIIFNKNQCD